MSKEIINRSERNILVKTQITKNQTRRASTKI